MPSASHKVTATSVPVIESNVLTSRIVHARTAHYILIRQIIMFLYQNGVNCQIHQFHHNGREKIFCAHDWQGGTIVQVLAWLHLSLQYNNAVVELWGLEKNRVVDHDIQDPPQFSARLQ